MSENKIQILNYGIGNIKSLSNALANLKVNHFISEKIEVSKNLKGLIIPGVGAFPSAMKKLEEKKLIHEIRNFANIGLPILGICLGMQILFTKGYEFEETPGLNLIEGSVEKIDKNLKIPNIGWRLLNKKKNTETFLLLDYEKKYYFVHSFFVNPLNNNHIMYSINYDGFEIPAIVNKENVFGFQFHPEKSGKDGLKLLKDFCDYSINNL